jgi:hypothetical protein
MYSYQSFEMLFDDEGNQEVGGKISFRSVTISLSLNTVIDMLHFRYYKRLKSNFLHFPFDLY